MGILIEIRKDEIISISREFVTLDYKMLWSKDSFHGVSNIMAHSCNRCDGRFLQKHRDESYLCL